MANGNCTFHNAKMKNIIRKVAKEGLEADFIILSADWQENSILLTVIDGDSSWSGKFNLEEMDSFCDTFNKPREVYFSEITEALRGGNDFIFTIEKESFVMKKIDARTNIKIRYCSIPLTKISSVPTYSHLVGRLLDNEVGYENRISEMTEELRFLKHEREDLLKSLEISINEKTFMETTLYSKFCEVLNSKKHKISSLQHQLESSGSMDQQNEPPKIKQEKVDEHTVLEDSSLSRKRTEEYGEPSNHRSKSVLPGEAGSNLNHYDSETDIDTEEEAELQQQSSNHDLNKKAEEKKPPPTDTNENKKRILPKRGSSKTNTQVIKKDTKVEKPTAKRSDELGEFNSQSLLDEF